MIHLHTKAPPAPAPLAPANAPSRAVATLDAARLEAILTTAMPNARVEVAPPVQLTHGASANEAGFVVGVARLMSPATAADALERALNAAGAGLASLFDQLLGPPSSAGTSALDARAQALEDRAFEVLEVLVPSKVGAAEAALGGWLDGLEARSGRGEPLEAIEHLTLLHALKQGLLAGQEKLAPQVARMQALVKASDARLFGKARALPEILEGRLPRAYLRQQSSDAKKIHDAVFATRDPSLAAAVGDLLKSYEPGRADAVAAVALGAMLFSGAGAQVVGGALHGYLLATLTEATLHGQVAHMAPKTKDKVDAMLSRFGPLGEAVRAFMDQMKFSHTNIHHGSRRNAR
jgi:hypothetical protein